MKVADPRVLLPRALHEAHHVGLHRINVDLLCQLHGLEARQILAARDNETAVVGGGDVYTRKELRHHAGELGAVGSEHEDLGVRAVDGGEEGALQQRRDEARHAL